MKNKKNLFYFFENIVSYESDISKIFSKKDNYIPIINSKKNVYMHVKNKKNGFSVMFVNISTPIIIYVLIEIILFFFKKNFN